MSTDLLRRLVMEGLLSEAEITAVVARRAVAGEPVPVALRALGLASGEAIEALLGRMGYTSTLKLSPSLHARQLPRGLMRALWVLPVGESPAGVVVAMVDPTDSHTLRETAWHLRKSVDPRAANLELLRSVLLEVDPNTPHSRTRPPSSAAQTAAEGPVLRVPALPASMNARDRASIVNLAGQRGPRRNTPLYGMDPSPSQRPTGAAAHGTGIPVTPTFRSQFPSAGGIGTGAPATARPPSTARPPELPSRRARPSRLPSAPALPREALYALGELRTAVSRDAVARVLTQGMLTTAERSAFFVVKRGVVQGWEGATLESAQSPGLSREALRNLWIPVTSPSVFREAVARNAAALHTLSDGTADSILAAALGQRPARVVLAPILVREHLAAFLYADGVLDDTAAVARAEDLCSGAAEALERLIVTTRGQKP